MNLFNLNGMIAFFLPIIICYLVAGIFHLIYYWCYARQQIFSFSEIDFYIFTLALTIPIYGLYLLIRF